jgi:hypothetical protein
MGTLAFLTPLFLYGALGALVPLLLHLIRRERVQVRPFSAYRFLKLSHQAVVRQQRLRRLLLLLLRMAACALLAMIFARPFLQDAPAAFGALQPKAIALVIDTSYSMRFGSRLELAGRHAREILQDLQPGDQAVLIAFSTQGRILRELSADHASLTGLLNHLPPTFQGTNYLEALRLADDQLNRSGFDERIVYLVSDFHQTGWERSAASWKLSPGVQLRIVDVWEEGDANIAVTDIDVPQPLTRTERTREVVVRVKNFALSPYQGTLKLTVNGRAVASQRIDMPAQSGQAAAFRHTFQEDANAGMVALDDDALPVDNRFYFTIGTPSPLRILCLEERPTRGSQPSAAYYLSQALGLRQDPPLTVETRPLSDLAGLAIGTYHAVLLADAGMLPRTASALLLDYVRSGGGLIIGLHPALSPSVFNTSFGELLPGRVRRIWPDDMKRDAYRSMADIDYQHPVFQPFAGPHHGDFGTARFFRVAQVETDSSATVLGRYDDGTPALLEKQMGQGRILMFTSTLDLSWNDFPIRGVFVPFLYQTVDYLAGQFSVRNQRTPYYRLIGEAVRLPAGSGAMVRTPSGEQIAIERSAAEPPLFSDTREPGLYEVDTDGGKQYVAINLDTRESDFTRLDVEEFVAAMINPVTESQEAQEMKALADRTEHEEIERRQRLWWYLSLGLLAIVLGETFLASRTHR